MFTLKQIASEVKGVIVGDSSIIITSVDDIEEAVAGAISFAFLPKYKKRIISSDASAFIVINKEDLQECPGIVVKNPYLAMIAILELFSKKVSEENIVHSKSAIAKSASLGKDIYIGAFAYIGDNVIIGDNVKIYPNVYVGDNVTIGDYSVLFSGAKLYSETIIGTHCVINSGAIIGADGFGFSPNEKGEFTKVPQTGNVILEDYVDVGAATTIDRATLGSTIIRRGVKLDNQIQIAHNVEIGQNTVIAGGVFIGGSTLIKAYSMIGGKSDVGPHIVLGKESILAARSCVLKSLNGGEMYAGNPARPIKEKQKRIRFTRLELLEKRLKKNDTKTKNN